MSYPTYLWFPSRHFTHILYCDSTDKGTVCNSLKTPRVDIFLITQLLRLKPGSYAVITEVTQLHVVMPLHVFFIATIMIT